MISGPPMPPICTQSSQRAGLARTAPPRRRRNPAPLRLPPTLGTAFNAALVSHVDTCHLGIDLDTTVVSDPDTFAAGLDAGLHMLLAAPATARE
ncbi:hypothetical protein [Nocardia farcinica]|nr:hypothetical protein [Nocardia farcinica]